MAGIMAVPGIVLVCLSVFSGNVYLDGVAIGWSLLTAGAYLLEWRKYGRGGGFLFSKLPQRPVIMCLWLITAGFILLGLLENGFAGFVPP